MPSDPHDILQLQVDELAERIGRPVDLEDRDLRVLAYSVHDHEIDAVRSRSILARSGPREVDAWMRRHGIHAAEDPLRLPAAPELGMEPRVCVPVRDARGLLGFLWLADEPGRPVAAADIDATVEAAAATAQVLRRMRDAEDEERAAVDVLVHAALRGETGAAEALSRSGALLPTPATTVVAARASADVGGRLRRLLPSRHALDVTGDPGELLLLVTLPTGTDLDDLVRRVADVCGTPAGIGDPHPSLADLPSALAQARAALLVAGAVPGRGPVLRFGEAGTDGTLALLPTTALDDLARAPELRRLADQDADGALRATLLSWLDHGGDANAAAQDLSLHRATLYHRLKRIETLAQVRLDDGDVRLALHLALRAARLRATPVASDG